MFESQEKVLEEIQGKAKILELGTGSGKTLISIQEYIDNWMEHPLLVICPNGKFKEGGWNREIEVIEDFYRVTLDYEIIPYSKLWVKRKIRGTKKYEMNPDLEQYRNHFIIFDEVHFVKNPTSERGKAATKLIANAESFLGLSATPMANGWEDTMNYFIWWGYSPNKTNFIKDYAQGLDRYYKPFGWNQQLLTPMWNEISVYRNKHDMTDLPRLILKDVFFKKHPDYERLKRDRILDGEVYDTVPKLFAKLRQLTSPRDKAEYTKELLESTNENIVIFYTFNNEYDNIRSIVPKDKKLFVVKGGEFKLPKMEERETLTNSVTLVQYKAGGTGIEMQYASVVVFFSPDHSYQDYEQALGRVYRTGQTENVVCYLYKTRGTVETKIWKDLADKKSFNPRRILE